MRNQDGVAGALEALVRPRGIPTSIRCGPQVRRDNGTEFASKAMDHWAGSHGVTLHFSRPGKPTDNGLIEAFDGRLRAECLNEHWFLTLGDVQDHLDAWREDYTGERPHSALQNMTPREFARGMSAPTPMGVAGGLTTRPQRPGSDGHKPAPQAENSHSGWYQDGGSSRQRRAVPQEVRSQRIARPPRRSHSVWGSAASPTTYSIWRALRFRYGLAYREGTEERERGGAFQQSVRRELRAGEGPTAIAREAIARGLYPVRLRAVRDASNLEESARRVIQDIKRQMRNTSQL